MVVCADNHRTARVSVSDGVRVYVAGAHRRVMYHFVCTVSYCVARMASHVTQFLVAVADAALSGSSGTFLANNERLGMC
jgi:hypothetical protein